MTIVDTRDELAIIRACLAAVAQLVERNLAKVEVESSRLFCRSIHQGKARAFPFRFKAISLYGMAG